MKISIVSPIYRAENIVEELVRQIIKSVEPLTSDFEIVLVNDASPDHSWMKIREICRRDSRVKGDVYKRQILECLVKFPEKLFVSRKCNSDSS